MKIKFFLFAAIAGMFLMTSCSKEGPSEEAKMQVAAFDSAWSAMGTSAMAWGDSLTQAVTMCETACKDGDAMECCEHLTGTKDSLMMPCKNDMKVFQDMKTAWDAEMPMWNELQEKHDALKESVSNGTATDESINAALTELQAAVDKGGSEMGPWIEKFNTAKATSISNMTTCKNGWAGAQCSDEECAAAETLN